MGDHVIEDLEAEIKKEREKILRCQRLGLRHKNKLPKLVAKYEKELSKRLKV